MAESLSTTAGVLASAVSETSSKEQTVIQTSICSSSSSLADNIFEDGEKLASSNKDCAVESVPVLESNEVNTAMNNDIVCELLEAKDDIKIKTDSEYDDTKDNDVSDRLNRIRVIDSIFIKGEKEDKGIF